MFFLRPLGFRVADFVYSAVEPPKVVRYAEGVAPAFEAFNVSDGAAGAFDLADAALGEVEPGREGGLRERGALGLAVGAEDLADVAGLERLAHGRLVPELGGRLGAFIAWAAVQRRCSVHVP
ncbi:hypothetical protein ACQPW3_39550 [Actinosynnema sp. CA-248983]